MLSEEVCREHDSLIRGMSFNMMRGCSYADWEDVVSDVYLSLCCAVNRDVYKGVCDIRTLIFVLVQRRVTDYIRLKYRRRRIIENLMPVTQEESSLNTEEFFIQKEQREILLGFTDRLPGWRQRDIMELYLSGSSRMEIAESLGVCLRFVDVSRYKAIQYFKNFMKGD